MLKRLFLHGVRLGGGFQLARYLTRRGVRILCYHGIAVADEHIFRPALFMSERRFRSRMETIRRRGHPVIDLASALDGLASGTLPDGAVVLTFDDGWYGTWNRALPVLEEFGFPATIYVTTYYAAYGEPVFNLLIRYLFWRRQRQRLDLGEVADPLSGVVDLTDPRACERAVNQVIRHGKSTCKAPEQTAVARRCAAALGVELEPLLALRLLYMMGEKEVVDAARRGFDIQLHTHRHRALSDAGVDVEREVADNRAVLRRWLPDRPFDHLCYPGGFYNRTVVGMAAAAGVVSATTCDGGLNGPQTPRLALRRYLDEENRPQIIFEADLAGVSALLHRRR